MPCSRAKSAPYLLLELAGVTPRLKKQDALLSHQICALFVIGSGRRNLYLLYLVYKSPIKLIKANMHRYKAGA